MKKIVIGIVLIMIMLGAALGFVNKLDESKNAKSDEQIEDELVKSMAETKREKANTEKFFARSTEELTAKGYGEVALGYSPEDRILTVQVEDKQFLKANRSQIEKIITNTATEVGFGDFVIEFEIADTGVDRNKRDQELMETMDKLSKTVSNVLRQEGYDVAYAMTVEGKEIIIEEMDEGLAGNEELENLIADAIASEMNRNYKVTIKKQSKNETRDREWNPVFNAIIEETAKKFKEYRGFASSFHPEPLQIIIKTKLKDSWFGNTDEKVKEMESYVDKIIELKMEELSIEEIPYTIIIRDKDDEKIN